MADDYEKRKLLQELERLRYVKLERAISYKIEEKSKELDRLVRIYTKIEADEAKRIKDQERITAEMRELYIKLRAYEKGKLSLKEQSNVAGINSGIEKLREEFNDYRASLQRFDINLEEVERDMHLIIIELG